MNNDTQNLEEQQIFEKNYHEKTYFGKTDHFDKELACKLGLNEAIFLDKLHRLLRSEKNTKLKQGFKWYFNTFDTWQEQYFPYWSKMTIKRVVYSLRGEAVDRNGKLKSEQNPALIVTTDEHNKMKRSKDHTLWYRINYAELHKLLQQNEANNQVSAYQNGTPKSYHSDTAMSYQNDTSITNNTQTITPTKGFLEEDLISKGNHEEKEGLKEEAIAPVLIPRGSVGEAEAVTTRSAQSKRLLYRPLTELERYKIAKELNVHLADVKDVEKDVLKMFSAGELKKLTNIRETTTGFLEARIRRDEITSGNNLAPGEILNFSVEDFHPLNLAGRKFQTYDTEKRSIEDARKQREASGSEITDLKTRMMKLKPLWEEAFGTFKQAKALYPERLKELSN
jgi:hypothetical protein